MSNIKSKDPKRNKAALPTLLSTDKKRKRWDSRVKSQAKQRTQQSDSDDFDTADNLGMDMKMKKNTQRRKQFKEQMP